MNKGNAAEEWVQMGCTAAMVIPMVWGALGGMFPSLFWWPFVGLVTVSKDEAVDAAESEGFTDVMLLDSDEFVVNWRGCANDDRRSFTGQATNARGERVDVQVCCGATRACRVSATLIK